MRGYESFVTNVRKQVFTEVARLAYEGGDYSRMEEIPYKIVPGEIASHRESIFLERAIAGERVRLAMGLPLRPVDEHTVLSAGVTESGPSPSCGPCPRASMTAPSPKNTTIRR